MWSLKVYSSRGIEEKKASRQRNGSVLSSRSALNGELRVRARVLEVFCEVAPGRAYLTQWRKTRARRKVLMTVVGKGEGRGGINFAGLKDTFCAQLPLLVLQASKAYENYELRIGRVGFPFLCNGFLRLHVAVIETWKG